MTCQSTGQSTHWLGKTHLPCYVLLVATDEAIAGDQMRSRMEALAERWSKGQASLKEIVGLDSEELYAISSQGYTFFLQGKIKPARVIFEGLLALDPRNSYFYRALGVIYWREKEPEKALQQFGYAIRVCPHEIVSYIGRAEVLVSGGRFQEAKKDLDFAIANAGATDVALVRKARAILAMIV